MTQTMAPATGSPSPVPPAHQKDGRTAQRALTLRMLARPEMGVFLGAAAVYVFFLISAPPVREASSMANVLYGSSTIGIMALPVALLMIGGEFDLSAGVAVITSALTASMLSYQLTMNVWVGVIAALVVSLAIGFLNGWLVVKTGLPSFLITLGSFLILQGVNLAVTKLVTANVATDDISTMDGFDQAKKVFASSFDIGGVQVKITIFWWLLFAAIATSVRVKQSGVVLKYVAAARERGLGVIFITHNPHHAYMVGDHFSVLRLGTLELSAERSEITLEELTNHMAGGTELAALKHELAQVRGVDVEELPEEDALQVGAPQAN
ncbi:ABC transporter permease subunit [Streptomyces mirabilis]|uniref:ABC transporter permease subunit n=1 Tax=Streptomyces mirabilis TaxID=68239 RepID=UPI0036EB1D10